MKLEQIEAVLLAAARLTNHRNFVVVGSLSILGAVLEPPERMVASIDLDFFLKFDPERVSDINAQLGESSVFARDKGYFADALSPRVLSLPAGWETRLIQLPLKGGLVAWFLDPNDCACSKLIRANANDIDWVRAGLNARILAEATIRSRLGHMQNVMDGDVARAMTALTASLV